MLWFTQDNERLGIPGVMMCDGPNGLRKQTGEGDHLGINESIETVCYPTASAFAASFDRELLEQLGELLGQECQAEHVAMLLGPGEHKEEPSVRQKFRVFQRGSIPGGEAGGFLYPGAPEPGRSGLREAFRRQQPGDPENVRQLPGGGADIA